LVIGDSFDAATVARLDEALRRAQTATKAPVISVAVALTGDGSAEATANLLLKQQRSIEGNAR
jgi:hypothetical protein